MQKEPWRIVVGCLSVAWIVYMWVKKDVAGIYAAMPFDQALLMILTTAAVSLTKVAVLAGLILLIQWLLGKFQYRNR